MTISYQFNVHTASFGGFARLLARWKGSIYKLVVKETIVFGICYGIVSMVYRLVLNDSQRRTFENIARHVGDNKNVIPLTFVLGFYVQFVVSRWWDQYLNYPWPDRVLNLVITYIPGVDNRSRLIRRTMARWLCLSTILLTRGVSVVAKKRFPTLEHLVNVGLMTHDEMDLYENVNIPYAKFFVPMLWFTELLKLAKKEKLMDDETGVVTKHVLEEVAAFRTNQWKIWSYDWVSIPLVYTQVVTWATYGYFFCCLFSRQFLDPEQQYEHFYVDFYFPVFTFLQFFFYVGWLKVAESLINPWGEDDDDFEVNWFIDRHVQVAFLVADEKFGEMPHVVKDPYWSKTYVKVPYTSVSALSRRLSIHNVGSAAEQDVTEEPLLFKVPTNQNFVPTALQNGDLLRLISESRTRSSYSESNLNGYIPSPGLYDLSEESPRMSPEGKLERGRFTPEALASLHVESDETNSLPIIKDIMPDEASIENLADPVEDLSEVDEHPPVARKIGVVTMDLDGSLS